VTIEQLRSTHQANPFRPFTIRLADGRSLHVQHCDFLSYSPSGRTLIVYHEDESFSIVELLLVTELEIIGAITPAVVDPNLLSDCDSPDERPSSKPPSPDIQNIDRVPAFTTLDGSEIRELLAHRNSSIRNQSLAEARLSAGQSTAPHFHRRTEEIYYIVSGEGQMRLGDDLRAVRAGDAIAIPPGAVHQLINTGAGVLKLLCCCAPGYEHEDTVLVGPRPA